jgi:hypothetical protein
MKKIVLVAFFCGLVGIIHAQENQLSTTGKVGIGTTSPESLLHVNGRLQTNELQLGRYSGKTSFHFRFENQVAGQKIDVYLPKYWGWLEVTVTSSFYNQNAPGRVSKRFALGLNPEGRIYCNESRYSEVMGETAKSIAISDISWDETAQAYKFTLVHRTKLRNIFSVIISGQSNSNGYIQNLLNIVPSEIYTEAWTLPKPEVSFPDKVNFDGQVVIAASSGDQPALVVEGNAEVRELLVTQQPGADFVFEEDYELMPLGELAQFIQQHRHLPEVPDAATMEKHGVQQGKMNRLLLQKVEELTLYLLHQQNTIDSLQHANNKIKELEEQLSTLQQQISKSNNNE